MPKVSNQKGFTVIELSIVLIVVVAIVIGAWFTWHSMHNKSTIHQSTATPVLGSLWSQYQTGYGSVKPSTVISGTDGASEVTDITWQSWGSNKATGHGKALYAIKNESNAQASFEPAVAVAFNLGTCKGKTAYTAFEWYFPEYGGSFNPHMYTNTCTGKSVGN